MVMKFRVSKAMWKEGLVSPVHTQRLFGSEDSGLGSVVTVGKKAV